MRSDLSEGDPCACGGSNDNCAICYGRGVVPARLPISDSCRMCHETVGHDGYCAACGTSSWANAPDTIRALLSFASQEGIVVQVAYEGSRGLVETEVVPVAQREEQWAVLVMSPRPMDV